MQLAEEPKVKGLNDHVKTENIPKQNLNTDHEIVNFDSQLFDKIGEKKNRLWNCETRKYSYRDNRKWSNQKRYKIYSNQNVYM